MPFWEEVMAFVDERGGLRSFFKPLDQLQAVLLKPFHDLEEW